MSPTALLSGVSRVWYGDPLAVNATRLFRRTFTVDDPAAIWRARLTLFADASYHLWCNGVHCGRGPTFFHPHRRPVDRYDLLPCLGAGVNTLAVQVHSPGTALHHYVPNGTPGLVARLDLDGPDGARSIVTNGDWQAAGRTGWDADVPRRSWAIGHVEHFDMAAAPLGWQAPDYDASAWAAAEVHPPFGCGKEGGYFDPALPYLAETFRPAVKLLRAAAAGAETFPLSAGTGPAEWGEALLAEPWEEVTAFTVRWQPAPDAALRVEGLAADRAAVLTCDLGAQYTGGADLVFTASSAGTVEIGWAELIKDDRPQVMRKGATYVDRIEARAGINVWQPHHFSSGRYLLLILRGFTGSVAFRRLGWRAAEPDCRWRGSFHASDALINAVWELCERTQRVGTQRALMDCPTREQAPYVGDGNPNALWIGRLTGDFSYWRRLITETFAVQGSGGLVKSTPFSGINNVLIDYNLLAVIGARDYLRETGDLETVGKVLDGCRRVIGWFDRWCRADGLFAFDWEKRGKAQPFPDGTLSPEPTGGWVSPGADTAATIDRPSLNVFIDHAGMGWHNAGEPGIDRRGLNAAMNALLVLGRRALADLLEACGTDGAAARRRQAAALAAAVTERFWSTEQGAFVDGVREGKPLAQVSQQTNTWCLMAGCAPAGREADILRRILDPADTAVARCGPYFYTYLLPLLARYGLWAEALAELRRWQVMLDGGATTLWETFAGDHLDSFCHPWSGAPVDFLPRRVAGIGALPQGASAVRLTPQCGLLAGAAARVETVRGSVALAWQTEAGGIALRGELPEGVDGELALPDGTRRTVHGGWSLWVPAG
jgi:alpha-L-rhamnosidase